MADVSPDLHTTVFKESQSCAEFNAEFTVF